MISGLALVNVVAEKFLVVVPLKSALNYVQKAIGHSKCKLKFAKDENVPKAKLLALYLDRFN